MKILASTLQRALHLALAGELSPELPSSEEIAFKDALSALKKGLPLEIDYSSYYDSSNNLTAMNGHPFGCACRKCFDIRTESQSDDLGKAKAALDRMGAEYYVEAYVASAMLRLTILDQSILFTPAGKVAHPPAASGKVQ